MRKNLLGGAAVCVGVTLSAFSVAWACTPGGGVNVNPSSGAAGTSVLVSANGYETTSEGGAGPVQIRWNSMSGPVLASASGPSFSTSVNIPENAAARTYYIVAVQQLSAGGTRTASAPFTVTSSAANQAPAPAPAPTQPQPQPQSQPQPATEQAPAPAPAGTETAAAPSAATPAPAAATPTRRSTSRVAPAAPRTGSTTAASSAPAAAAPAPAGTAEPVPTPGAEPAAPVAEPPSERTVSSDVWSGFSDGTTSRGPSLVEPTSSANGSRDAALGLGLVALGTVGLLGGTAVGIRSRRRPVAVEASAETE